MLRNLISCVLSKFQSAEEADPIDLTDLELRPYTVKTWISFWTPLSLHTKCDNRTVHELKAKGFRVYPFTAEGSPQDYIWVKPENIVSTTELCSSPHYWMPWI